MPRTRAFRRTPVAITLVSAVVFTLVGTAAGTGPNGATAAPSPGNPATVSPGASASARLTAGFVDPPTEYRPMYRYWYPGGRTDQVTLRQELREIRDGGGGGVELLHFVRDNSVAPIDDYSPEQHGFGSPAFGQRFTDAFEFGRRLGLRVDTTYTSKYSANLATVSPDEKGSAKELRFGVARVAAGDRFDDAPPRPELPDNVDQADLVAIRAYPCDSACEDDVPVLDPDDSVDLADEVADNRIDWTAPTDDSRPWVLVASWMHGTGQIVEGEETPGPSYVVDHFSSAGLDAVVDFWDERLLDHRLLRALRAGNSSLFFDSLELNRDGEQLRHWTDAFLREFDDRRGYDLEPFLPTVAVATPAFDLADGTGERIREDYRRTLNELLLEYHVLPLRAWAHELGMTLRGQPYSSWGPSFTDPIELWSEVDIPEGEDRSFNSGASQDFIETSGSDAWRAAATAAALTESDLVSNECCASFGRAHRVPRQDLLSHVNQSFSVGVNHIVWHGWSHNAPGTAASWPGWAGFGNTGVDDSYGPRNPTWDDDQAINDYVGRMQLALRTGEPRTDVAFYHQKPGHSPEGTTGERYFTSSSLEQRGYTYGFVNRSLLTGDDTPVRDGILAPDGPQFQAFVINDEEAMDPAVADRVLAMARDGLPIVVVGPAPDRARGRQPDADDAVRAAFDGLRAEQNVRWVDTEDDVPTALTDLGVAPHAALDGDTDLVGTHRSADGLDVYYWYNTGEERATTTAEVAADGTAYLLDAWTGEIEPLASHDTKDGRTVLPLDLAPGDAELLVVSDDPLDVPPPDDHTVGPDGAIEVSQPIVLDEWELSIESWQPGDGPQDTAVEELPTREVVAAHDGTLPTWDQLAPDVATVSGVGTYRTTVTVDDNWSDLAGVRLDLGTVTTTYQVTINGHRLPPQNQVDTSRVDVGPWLQRGDNDIEIRVASMLGNAIADSAVNSYGLSGPVHLQPNR